MQSTPITEQSLNNNENHDKSQHVSTPTLTPCYNLKCLSLNCCNLRSPSKKAGLLALIDEINPDIICGCETHLDQSYYSSEIFPDSYIVLRKDRVEGAGGVFVCVKKKQFNVTEEYELNADTELIWAKVTIPNKRPIYVTVHLKTIIILYCNYSYP